MNREIDLIKEVVRRLNGAGIGYMITGSMAMAVYAAPRMTRDVDIVIQVSDEDADSMVELFRGDFYIDETAVREAIRSRGMFNIIHDETIIKFDFIVRKDEEYRREEFNRRLPVEIDGQSIDVAAPEDLVLSKLVWAKQSGSELQLRDVRQLLAGMDRLDDEYLDKWSEALGVRGLLDEARTNE